MPLIIDDIKKIATLMRKATKHYIRSKEGMEQTMGGFCIAASLALRDALAESGYDDSRVVRGRFKNKGHAWVETRL